MYLCTLARDFSKAKIDSKKSPKKNIAVSLSSDIMKLLQVGEHGGAGILYSTLGRSNATTQGTQDPPQKRVATQGRRTSGGGVEVRP